MQTVIETASFLSDAKKAKMADEEREEFKDFIARNPDAGDLIEGSGGARKVRFARRGKGKSGGYRIITYFGGSDIPVFLMNVFAKGDKVSLSDAEANELRQVLSGAAKRYREGVDTRTVKR